MLLLRLPRIGFLENSMKPTIPEVSKARQLPTLYKGSVLNPLSSVLVDANGGHGLCRLCQSIVCTWLKEKNRHDRAAVHGS